MFIHKLYFEQNGFVTCEKTDNLNKTKDLVLIKNIIGSNAMLSEILPIYFIDSRFENIQVYYHVAQKFRQWIMN